MFFKEGKEAKESQRKARVCLKMHPRTSKKGSDCQAFVIFNEIRSTLKFDARGSQSKDVMNNAMMRSFHQS